MQKTSVKSTKLCTPAQVANDTLATKPLGTKIAHSSNNSGNGTVETHCINSISLPVAGVDIRFNELHSQIETLKRENAILLATIGLLTGQSTNTPLPLPEKQAVEKITPTKAHDKLYCDATMTGRFSEVCKKVQMDMDTYNATKYKGGPFPCFAAKSLSKYLKSNTAKLECFLVSQLNECENAYKIR